MVDVEQDPEGHYVILTTDKRVEKFYLEKDRSGYAHYVFRTSKGPLPDVLKGKFTSIQKGIEWFNAFDRAIKESNAVRQNELQKHREARRAKSSSESP